MVNTKWMPERKISQGKIAIIDMQIYKANGVYILWL